MDTPNLERYEASWERAPPHSNISNRGVYCLKCERGNTDVDTTRSDSQHRFCEFISQVPQSQICLSKAQSVHLSAKLWKSYNLFFHLLKVGSTLKVVEDMILFFQTCLKNFASEHKCAEWP